jgi:hypothetical protein
MLGSTALSSMLTTNVPMEDLEFPLQLYRAWFEISKSRFLPQGGR